MALNKISIKEAEKYVSEGCFKAGSMLPKIESAIQFAKFGGTGIITDIDHLRDALSGQAGTIITK